MMGRNIFARLGAVALAGALVVTAACDRATEPNGHAHPAALQIFDRAVDRDMEGDPMLYTHGTHWHGGELVVEEGERLSLGFRVLDADGHTIPLGTEYTIRAHTEDQANCNEGTDVSNEYVRLNSHGDHLHVHGLEHGHTDIRFCVWHGDHSDYESPWLHVDVEDDHHDHDHD
jgi:hypothetical protein